MSFKHKVCTSCIVDIFVSLYCWNSRDTYRKVHEVLSLVLEDVFEFIFTILKFWLDIGNF